MKGTEKNNVPNENYELSLEALLEIEGVAVRTQEAASALRGIAVE